MARIIQFPTKSKAARQPRPKARIEAIVTKRVTADLADFARNLDCARVLWRAHREMVEAEEFPEYLRRAHLEENGDEACGVVDYGTPDIAILRDEHLPDAEIEVRARPIKRA